MSKLQNQEKVGIIAGGGQFPNLIAREAKAAGKAVIICGFHGHTAPDLAAEADRFTMLHLGQMNRLIDYFRKNQVTQLCLAGTIDKPRALDLRPDLLAARLVFSLKKKGDDSLLRAILGELEQQGFTILSAADLAPSLRSPPGNLTRTRPDPQTLADIEFAWPIASTLGSYDIGQCLVVRQGMVMAVECLEGTDATLKRGAELGGAGCVAVKLSKPGQDRRVDLPAVGLTTIQLLADHKYAALAIQARQTLLFDRQASLALADRHHIAVLALP